VPVLERSDHGREAWLRIDGDAWLRARDTTAAELQSPPVEVRPEERWIDVDLAHQMLVAYRGERALFALPVSTGRGPEGTELATPPGLHRVWIKLRTSDMDNLENLEAERNYAIQAVPWVMYFDHGYGLHGAFWHRAFGRVQSHGCVNLTPADAERLFDWSSPRLPAGWSAVFPTDHELGTLVRVR
jgi:lipoprotein-anchoring transpeptidase ErfK/SrfK